jgi:hypothetical protein
MSERISERDTLRVRASRACLGRGCSANATASQLTLVRHKRPCAYGDARSRAITDNTHLLKVNDVVRRVETPRGRVQLRAALCVVER